MKPYVCIYKFGTMIVCLLILFKLESSNTINEIAFLDLGYSNSVVEIAFSDLDPNNSALSDKSCNGDMAMPELQRHLDSSSHFIAI